MAYDKSPGMNRLANVLAGRMKQETRHGSPAPFDLGTMQGDGSLLVDTFPEPIPQGEYLVCGAAKTNDGDRVLVAWALNDAVVVGKVKKS